MLHKIKLFFDQHMDASSPDQITEENLRFACAALFVEMMHIDDEILAQEYKMILKSVQKLFSLSTEQANTLISLATQQREQATDYYQFTSMINKGFTQKQKTSLIKTLWEIAYVDGILDKHEEHMVRKIADLLHVPHLEFIRTKHQVYSGEL